MYLVILDSGGTQSRGFSLSQLVTAVASPQNSADTRITIGTNTFDVSGVNFAAWNKFLQDWQTAKIWQARGGGIGGYAELRETT